MCKFVGWLMIAVFALMGCKGHDAAAPVHDAAAPVPVSGFKTEEVGARIYDANCVPCHQQDARGISGVYPSLVGSAVLLGDPKDLALWVVKGRRPASLPAGRFATAMPQFGWMSAQNAAALFTYARSHFGNSAAPVDAATVARALGAS